MGSATRKTAITGREIITAIDTDNNNAPVSIAIQDVHTNTPLISPTLQGNVTYTPVALATTGTVSWNLTSASTFTLTPTGNMTLNATGLAVGQDITLIILTSGVSSYTITFGTNIRPSSGTLATGTVTGKYFIIQYTCDGTQLVETLRTSAT